METQAEYKDLSPEAAIAIAVILRSLEESDEDPTPPACEESSSKS